MSKGANSDILVCWLNAHGVEISRKKRLAGVVLEYYFAGNVKF